MLGLVRRYIGVEVVGDVAYAIALRLSRRAVEVENFAVAGVEQMQRQLAHWRGKLVVGLGSSAVTMKYLTVAAELKRREVLSYLVQNAERLTGVSKSELSLDFSLREKLDVKRELLLVATKEERVQLVRKLWPRVAVVDVVSLALLRTVAFLGYQSEQLQLAVVLRQGCISFCLLQQDKILHAEDEFVAAADIDLAAIFERKLQLFATSGFGEIANILLFIDSKHDFLKNFDDSRLPCVHPLSLLDKLRFAESCDRKKFVAMSAQLAPAFGLALWSADD